MRVVSVSSSVDRSWPSTRSGMPRYSATFASDGPMNRRVCVYWYQPNAPPASTARGSSTPAASFTHVAGRRRPDSA